MRANIIWLFRKELVKLELHELRWLDAILQDAYLAITGQVRRFVTNEEAFDYSVALVRNNIEQRIALMGADAELGRLLQLADQARPCDAIQEIFSQLARNTRNIYRTAPRRTVRLQRLGLSGHPLGSTRPGDFADPYHVDAQTKVDAKKSSIELQIYLDEFGVPSLLAIPALLTHELVCHAYANDGKSDKQSIWAEGVMDWTALFFFEQWTVRLGLPYAAVRSHGEALWDRRMTPTRYTGRAIADTLVEWLANYASSVRGPTMARRVTARFALEINVAAASLLQKDALASRIANIETDVPLQEAFDAWRTGVSKAEAMLT